MSSLFVLLLASALALPPTLAQQATHPVQRLSIVNYDLDVDVRYDDDAIEGRSRITLRNHSDGPADEASILLYRLLSADSVLVAGREAAFGQTVETFTDFAKLQVNHLVIALTEPVAPGDTVLVEVSYSGHLLGYSETGMRYIRDHIDPEFTILRDDAWAFPRPGYPSFAVNRQAPMPSYRYVARVTVPDTLVVANGGRLMEVSTSGGRATYVYESLQPSWRMDFAIAGYRKIEALPVRIFYFPADSAGARRVAEASLDAFEIFESWFGVLQEQETLSFIEIPDGWGSQADATAIIQAAAAFRDSTRLHEVYHEISHLWNVPPTDRPSPRWNEGLATFLEYLTVETLTGEPAVDERMDFLMKWLKGTLPERPGWSEVPLIRYGEEDMTGLSYTVGALFFDQLYRFAGTERFNEIVRTFYRRHHETGGSTDELIRLIRQVAGDGVDAMVSDWISTTDWTTRVRAFDSAARLAEYYDDRRDR